MSGQGKAVDGPAKGGTTSGSRSATGKSGRKAGLWAPTSHHVAGAFGSYSQILSKPANTWARLSPIPWILSSRVLGK